MKTYTGLPDKKIQQIYEHLVEGIKEYMKTHGFSSVVLGLSGGVDSAVVGCLAAEAAGKENVLGIAMPSGYSSPESEELAFELTQRLGIQFKRIPISGVYGSYLDELEKHLGEGDDDEVTIYHQNIQARIRGNILMAFSNRYGHLVLSTGNKSEAMMGYCTLYGDTVGGLAVLADIFKSDVYRLADMINREKEIIPRNTIERAPSAELKPGQRDEDSLPPYGLLDEILLLILERKVSPHELEEQGFDPDMIKDVVTAIKNSEYKRKQCPEGIIIGHLA